MDSNLNELAHQPALQLLIVLLIVIAPSIGTALVGIVRLRRQQDRDRAERARERADSLRREKLMASKIRELEIKASQDKDATQGKLLHQALDLSEKQIISAQSLEKTIIDLGNGIKNSLTENSKIVSETVGANIEATRERTIAAEKQTVALNNIIAATEAFRPYLDQVAARNLEYYEKAIAVQTQAITAQGVNVDAARQSITAQLDEIMKVIKQIPNSELMAAHLVRIDQRLTSILNEFAEVRKAKVA